MSTPFERRNAKTQYYKDKLFQKYVDEFTDNPTEEELVKYFVEYDSQMRNARASAEYNAVMAAKQKEDYERLHGTIRDKDKLDAARRTVNAYTFNNFLGQNGLQNAQLLNSNTVDITNPEVVSNYARSTGYNNSTVANALSFANPWVMAGYSGLGAYDGVSRVINGVLEGNWGLVALGAGETGLSLLGGIPLLNQFRGYFSKVGLARAIDNAVEESRIYPWMYEYDSQPAPTMINYQPVTVSHKGVTINPFVTLPTVSKLSEAERLGIPKGDRGNLDRFQLEALEDLRQYRESGLFNQNLALDSYGNIIWQESPYSFEQNILRYPNVEIVGSNNYKRISIPYKSTLIKYYPLQKDFMVNGIFPTVHGEAVCFPYQGGKIILTSPYVDAFGSMGSLQPNIDFSSISALLNLPKRIDSNIMRNFWAAVLDTRRPGTYFSGDQGRMPLGYTLILDYKNRLNARTSNVTGSQEKSIVGINGYNPLLKHLLTKLKWFGRDSETLSTDSYLALLKLGNRDGYSLRYSPDGMNVFNNSGVDNQLIYDALNDANNGIIPLEEFIKLFNNWVLPYNGMPARIVNGKIIMPHPFVYKKENGGTLYKKKEKAH